ncbi:MAG: hypothetical protein ACT4QD_01980 [Acidobacteriota bacterium]
MPTRLRTILTALTLTFVAAAATAQPEVEPPATAAAPDGGAPLDLFGLQVAQTEHLKISGLLIAGWSHDGAQAQLGFEKQGRVAQATVTFSGRVTERVRYLVSFNPVNEVASKPACGESGFFFPNDPRFYAVGPVVPCDPEDGHKRVDTYNTFALDYVNQQGPLREGYVDWRPTDAISTRFGRFILPIGFEPHEVGSWTAKDLTRIQRLNAEASFGWLIAYSHRTPGGRPLVDAAIMAVLGDGNREKDYDWFYFADPTLDTNSALTAVASLRTQPVKAVDLRLAYKKGFTGSKVERLPSYWASKRTDDALVVSARVKPHAWVSAFGEYARYVWGPTATSAELVGVDPAPIVKPGYYVGGSVEVPVAGRVSVGLTVTREELSRDDSLVKFLASNGLYGVSLGRKDRGTIVRAHVDVARLVTIGAFWADVSNPYPWISGSWPVSGPEAFRGRAMDRYGLAVVVRTP